MSIKPKTNLNKRLHAEKLYIEDGWTAKDVAHVVGSTENTVGTWVKKYGWKDKRNEVLAAPHKIRQILLGELELVSKGEKAKIDSDAISKITRAIERLDKGVNNQTIITVLKLYTDWCTTQGYTSEQLEFLVNSSKDFFRYRIDYE